MSPNQAMRNSPSTRVFLHAMRVSMPMPMPFPSYVRRRLPIGADRGRSIRPGSGRAVSPFVIPRTFASASPPTMPDGSNLLRGTGRHLAIRQLFESFFEATNDLNQFHDFCLAQEVKFLMQHFNFEFSLSIGVVIMLSGFAVDHGLSILAHHDERCRIGSLKR